MNRLCSTLFNHNIACLFKLPFGFLHNKHNQRYPSSATPRPSQIPRTRLCPPQTWPAATYYALMSATRLILSTSSTLPRLLGHSALSFHLINLLHISHTKLPLCSHSLLSTAFKLASCALPYTLWRPLQSSQPLTTVQLLSILSILDSQRIQNWLHSSPFVSTTHTLRRMEKWTSALTKCRGL